MTGNGRHRYLGFTVVEVLVATSLGAFGALVAIASMKGASTTVRLVQDNSDRAIELRFAARRLAMDLTNIVRDTDPNYFRLEVGTEDSGAGSQSYLTFWTTLHQKVRQGQPEGDVYEVSYYIADKGDGQVFCRRVWPHPDRQVSEPGGVVTVLSDQIALLRVLCYDGERWLDQWSDSAQELPHMIEVTLATKADTGGMALSESILVTVLTASEAQALAQAQSEAAAQEVQATEGTTQSTTTQQGTSAGSTGQTTTGGGR
jgi:type II secretion system protein J